MKKIISRNIAIVSAIFIVAFSIMLITNYFQIRNTDTIQAEVIETLKKANDENAGNPELQEQIRELDLLARKAYFVSQDRLHIGAFILLVMAIVFVISTRVYFAKSRNLPDKEIDPIDDWMIKTKARRYVTWVGAGLAVIALIFAILSSPLLKSTGDKEMAQANDSISSTIDPADVELSPLPELAEAVADTAQIPAIPTDTVKADSLEISKITFNTFRNNNGAVNARKIPTSWNLTSGKNILWKINSPRKGYNSPVINGNKVFLSGADAQARELYCYELSSGKLLWSLAAKNIAGSPAQMPKTTDDTGLAASTVATNGKQVCAIFASGDIICADMDGKQLWAKNVGVPTNHYGYASSLLIFGSSVIIQYDNNDAPRVFALDLATGAQRWSKTRPDKIAWSSPIIAYVNKKPQLILMGNPSITSYNPNNGEQNWRVECMSGEVGASPTHSNGIIYGASEYSSLIAINGEDGSTLWKVNDFLPEVSSPVATKNNVFIATSYGVMACYDAQTGALTKTHELNTEFYSSPVIAEGKLYIFSNSGKMYVFSTNSDFKLINSFDTGEKTFATPAFTDKKIVVRSENSIYCVEAN